MSFRCKRRGLHATLTALVASACTIVALLALMAATASASNVPCPSGRFTYGEIKGWRTYWPTSGADGRGVTLCDAYGGMFNHVRGILQIVDLGAGAKIKLVDQRNNERSPDPYPELGEIWTQFDKHTADRWYEIIRRAVPALPEEEEPPVESSLAYPRRELLVSTVNASFFARTEGETTQLSFLHYSENWGTTWGVGMNDPENPDYTNPKQMLAIGTQYEWVGSVQRVRVGDFPDTYHEYEDVKEIWDCSNDAGEEGYCTGGLVAFEPRYAFGDPRNRRNFLGWFGNKVYIFTSWALYNQEEMIRIMEEIQPNMDLIQLDGGGSAQIYSPYLELISSELPFPRDVPDVLAVYKAKEGWRNWER